MSDDGDMSFDGPPSLQWWLDVYPHIRPGDRPLECTQLPGETIFVPGGWWHCVLNIEESVAVTHNFMNEAGFETVLSDLAPGHAHRALFRAGRLAQTHLVDSPEQTPSPADIAWAHFTSPGEDYISKQALRELLRKMWAIRPDLRKRLWQCACKTVGAQHWQGVLGAVSRAHGLVSPGREESLPLSGGRNAIFRLGGKVVKVFVRLVDEDESEDDEDGRGGQKEECVGNAGEVLSKKRGQRGGTVTKTVVTKAVRDGSETGVESNGRAEFNLGPSRNGEEEHCERQDCTEEDDDETPGTDQEEMFRTELLMHELIRTSGSPLSATVPALLGRGVLVEAEDGSLTPEETESAGVCPTETELQNGRRKPGSITNAHANGRPTSAQDLLQNGFKIEEGLQEGGRSVRGPPPGLLAVEEKRGPMHGKRRWMYVITAECEGTPLADVYDQLSKAELLGLARFLSRLIGYIHALPLPPDAGQTSKPCRPLEGPTSPDHAHPSKRQRVVDTPQVSTKEAEFQPQNGAQKLPQPEGRAKACSHLELQGDSETMAHLGCNGHLGAHSHPGSPLQIGILSQPGAHSHPDAHLHYPPKTPIGAKSQPGVTSDSGADSRLGATSHPNAESPEQSNLQPEADLPSLESLRVPPRWHPFAAFLRAQRKELPERVTDLGLPTSLVTSAEEFIPRDPVELLDFRTDPVWLHTDLLPDNILVKRRPVTGSDAELECAEGKTAETGTVTGTETEMGKGTETENGAERGANAGMKTAVGTDKHKEVRTGPGTETESGTRTGPESETAMAHPALTEQELIVAGAQSRRRGDSNGAQMDGDVETGGGKRVEMAGVERKPRRGRYSAAHILDFADARTGDPLYEIASLHIGTFRGRPELLTAFLRASEIPAEKAPGDCAPIEAVPVKTVVRGTFPHTRSFRAMCFAVLHEINLLNLLSRHRHSALSDSRTWEELTHALFGELDIP